MRIISPYDAAQIYVWTEAMEEQAEAQARRIARLPFVYHHVALMPDVHYGKGATVGSVLALNGAVIPAAVGVDIGCGMAAVKTNLTSHDFGDGAVSQIRAAIERGVPTGFNSHSAPRDDAERWAQTVIWPERALAKREHYLKQLGTLGGGNHFIELCVDTNDTVWIMLHSGSRGLGVRLAEDHIEYAQEVCSKYFVQLPLNENGKPEKDLAYLAEGTREFAEYLSDVEFAQEYASENRRLMLIEVIRNLRHYVPKLVLDGDIINCHHNYISREFHYGRNVIVTRKGAIRAREGELGIIPGSMGTKSYIVAGLGNMQSFHSCSHGAGRRMSRKKAKEMFTAEDLAKQTEGVECPKTAEFVDEIPAAYKDIDEVMENQKDLVRVVAQLKQFMCIKGASDDKPWSKKQQKLKV